MIVKTMIATMGMATVWLSLFAALRFHQARSTAKSDDATRLTLAVTLQLVGESIIGAGTLIFSVAAMVGWLDAWSENLQSAIRFVMFFATATTTWHLMRTIDRLDGR